MIALGLACFCVGVAIYLKLRDVADALTIIARILEKVASK